MSCGKGKHSLPITVIPKGTAAMLKVHGGNCKGLHRWVLKEICLKTAKIAAEFV